MLTARNKTDFTDEVLLSKYETDINRKYVLNDFFQYLQNIGHDIYLLRKWRQKCTDNIQKRITGCITFAVLSL